MRALLQDLRYAVRVLRKSAGSTTVALLTLALAIGANTAIFSVVYGVLLQPLPYREPDRLITLRGGESALNLADFKAQNHTLLEMGGFGEWPLDLTGEGEPRSIPSALISGNLFETLGVKPMLGRTLTAADDQMGGARLVVASYGFWKSVLNGNPQAVGNKLILSGVPYTLVGVMPPGFEMPRGTTQLWVPLKVAYPEAAPARNAQFLYGIGRMRDRQQLAAVQADIDAIGKRLSENYSADNLDRKWHVVPLHERVVGKVQRPLLILLGSGGCILLIACGNLAGLVLARAAGRRQEIAVRGALGATRFRIVRQLLSESLLLSLAGGAAGVMVAYLGLDLLLAMKPEDVPRLENVSINSTALLFTLGISLLAAILFGLVPAFQLSDTRSDNLNLSGRVAETGFRRSLLRRVLVVAEIAMALMLLIGAGLLIRSFWKLNDVDPGFRPDHLVTLSLQLPVARYDEIAKQESFFAELDRRMQIVPGVESAAIISELPLGGSTIYHNVVVASQPPMAAGTEPEALAHEISPGYFATMGVSLLQGRDFDLHDDHNNARVAIVSQGFVREQLHGKNPIGERLRFPRAEDSSWFTIVGVAADTKHSALDADECLCRLHSTDSENATLEALGRDCSETQDYRPVQSHSCPEAGGMVARSSAAPDRSKDHGRGHGVIRRTTPLQYDSVGTLRRMRPVTGDRWNLRRPVAPGDPAHARNRDTHGVGSAALRLALTDCGRGWQAGADRNCGRNLGVVRGDACPECPTLRGQAHRSAYLRADGRTASRSRNAGQLSAGSSR